MKERDVFWEKLNAHCRNSCELEIFKKFKPRGLWNRANSGIDGCLYGMGIDLRAGTKKVNFSIDRNNKMENSVICNFLHSQHKDVERLFGGKLEWCVKDRSEWQARTNIQFKVSLESFERTEWPELIEWFCENMTNLVTAMEFVIPKAKNKLQIY